MADKKLAATADDVMAPGVMKSLLAKSKAEPVSCALALSSDKDGVLLLHKLMRPKKLSDELRKRAKDAGLALENSSVRFGMAEVDTDIDPTLVRFRVNKSVGAAVEPKIRERVRKGGFTKVEFVVDESLEREAEGKHEGEPDGQAEAPGAGPPLDADALRQRLRELIPQIGAAAVAAQAALKQLAGEAAGRLKSGDVASAMVFVDELAAALATPPTKADEGQQAPTVGVTGATPETGAAQRELRSRVGDLAPSLRRARELGGDAFATVQAQLAEMQRLQAAGEMDQALDLMDEIELALAGMLPPSNVGFQKLRLRWQTAKEAANAQVAALRAAVETEYSNDALAANAKRLDEVLAHFNMGLADTLDAFGNAEPGLARAELKQRAGEIAQEYLAFLDGSALVTHVEDNPFVPVDVRLALMQTLQLIEMELAKGGA